MNHIVNRLTQCRLVQGACYTRIVMPRVQGARYFSSRTRTGTKTSTSNGVGFVIACIAAFATPSIVYTSYVRQKKAEQLRDEFDDNAGFDVSSGWVCTNCPDKGDTSDGMY